MIDIGDCWEWTRGRDGNGYGRARADGKMVYVHRQVWTELVGPIPAGLELDHLCRNPACCNPDHLEPVTHRENIRRGRTKKHDSEPCVKCASTEWGWNHRGSRYCKPCNRAKVKAAKAKKRTRLGDDEVYLSTP